jgi:hypothetical protein
MIVYESDTGFSGKTARSTLLKKRYLKEGLQKEVL